MGEVVTAADCGKPRTVAELLAIHAARSVHQRAGLSLLLRHAARSVHGRQRGIDRAVATKANTSKETRRPALKHEPMGEPCKPLRWTTLKRSRTGGS